MTIDISSVTLDLIQAQVTSGAFANPAEVVEAAVRLLDLQKRQQKRLEEVRAMVAVGIEQADQGLTEDADDAFDEVDRELDAMMEK